MTEYIRIGDFLDAYRRVRDRSISNGIRISQERLVQLAQEEAPAYGPAGQKDEDMANGVNSVTLIGNLGKDPEVRYSDKGTAVCNMRIAITEREKRGDAYEDVTEWVDVVCFGKTAENCGQYLKKGRQVYVNGKMQTRSYEKDGQKRYATEVKAFRVNFLGGGEQRERSDNRRDGRNELQRSTPDNQGFYDGDNLPF